MALPVPHEIGFYDEILDFFMSHPNEEQVAAFRPSEAAQKRMEYLLDANRTGVMTPDERTELDEFMRAEHFVRMLKIRARERLNQA